MSQLQCTFLDDWRSLHLDELIPTLGFSGDIYQLQRKTVSEILQESSASCFGNTHFTIKQKYGDFNPFILATWHTDYIAKSIPQILIMNICYAFMDDNFHPSPIDCQTKKKTYILYVPIYLFIYFPYVECFPFCKTRILRSSLYFEFSEEETFDDPQESTLKEQVWCYHHHNCYHDYTKLTCIYTLFLNRKDTCSKSHTVPGPPVMDHN